MGQGCSALTSLWTTIDALPVEGIFIEFCFEFMDIVFSEPIDGKDLEH